MNKMNNKIVEKKNLSNESRYEASVDPHSLFRYSSVMNTLLRLNLIKQFQLKRLSHIINPSLLYTTSTLSHYQERQQVKIISF